MSDATANDKSAVIVTLCKSLNAGAFLQAYALQEVLKSRGLSVTFLDVYDFKQSLKRFHVLFSRQDRTFKGIVFGLRKYFAFRRAEKSLRFVGQAQNQSFSLAFLGSDEIWSVVNTSFVSIPEFFGHRVKARIKVSYAPSAGNTSLAEAAACDMVKSGLQQLDHVSARDASTRGIAESLLAGKEVTQVLDPTFLYDFSGVEQRVDLPGPYVAVYSYGCSATQIEQVRQFALDKGCKTVSPSFNNDWCDIVLPCGPFEFLSVIKNAAFVVTDTFHGTIFAIKYERPLICYAAQKRKVQELLADLELEACAVDTGGDAATIRAHTDYSRCRKILTQRKEASERYIDCCISATGITRPAPDPGASPPT